MNNTIKVHINRKYKDRLFRLVFGAEENKKYLLSLYNALNGTNYQNEDDLEITTLDDAIYMHMKNDVSFIIECNLDLFEHQSTFNPNMPLRGFMYFGHLYDQYIKVTNQDIYGKKLVKIPTPQYIVFYNGTDEYEDRIDLKLSDAFINKDASGSFEWTATMININAGHNNDLMDKCEALKEYSNFIQLVRDYQKTMSIDLAVDMAVKNAEQWNCLGNYLKKHRSEVVNVVLTEYDEKLHEETCYAEGLQDGIKKGLQDGMKKGLQDGMKKGLQDGMKKGEEQATILGIINIIRSFGCSIDKAMDVLKVSADKRKEYAHMVEKKLSSDNYE